eukprot:15706017-Heterocapsa_arctica.AAC.1
MALFCFTPACVLPQSVLPVLVNCIPLERGGGRVVPAEDRQWSDYIRYSYDFTPDCLSRGLRDSWMLKVQLNPEERGSGPPNG